MRKSLIDPENPSKPNRSLSRTSLILKKSFYKSFHNELNEDAIFLVNPNNVNKNLNKKPDVENNKIVPVNENIKQEIFKPKSNLTPYLLLIALSLHGFFEGIALGIQNETQDVMFLAIAILSHKWAESFTLVRKDLKI